MNDGRSKLARLAHRIERDLLTQYPPATELDRMKIEQAALLRALAKATGSSLGADSKVTPGRFGKLVGRADGAEARLAEQHAARTGNGHGADDLSQAILAMPPLSPAERPER